MKWILFLDDTRDPPWMNARYDTLWQDYVLPIWPEAKESDLTLCRSVSAAKSVIESRGLPVFMTLDHDMGQMVDPSLGQVLAPTGLDFLKWLQNTYPQGPIPPYRIHSANTVACGNMYSFLASWEKSMGMKS